jgi:hypothetical protein
MTITATTATIARPVAGRLRRTLEVATFAILFATTALNIIGYSGASNGVQYPIALAFLSLFLVAAGLLVNLPIYRFSLMPFAFAGCTGAYLFLIFTGGAPLLVANAATGALISAIPSTIAFVRGRKI